MTRILYFSRDYTTHDHRFLSALAQTEHQVGYLRLEKRGQDLDDRPLPPEIEIIPWAGGKSEARFQDGLKLLSGLRKVIREFKPDLIQAGPIQRSAFLAALTGFRPLLSMSWGYDLLMDVNKNKWWGWATTFTLRRSNALLGDCNTIRNLAGDYGMKSDRIVTFPWGVNIEKYFPGEDSGLRQRLGWGDDIFVLLSTRGWAPIYGVEDLAKAFAQAAQQRPELRLLMLGNGPLASKIRKIFTNAGVQDQVHFPGLVNQNNLPAYYRAADLYISTSHSDGTSISLLEALASGKPVLLSDIPGNQEWVTQPGEIGWLFNDGDVCALREGILRALDHREQLPALGAAARQLAEARANWDDNFPKLFEAYRLALSR